MVKKLAELNEVTVSGKLWGMFPDLKTIKHTHTHTTLTTHTHTAHIHNTHTKHTHNTNSKHTH